MTASREARSAVQRLLRGWSFDVWDYRRRNKRFSTSPVLRPGRRSQTGSVALLVAVDPAGGRAEAVLREANQAINELEPYKLRVCSAAGCEGQAGGSRHRNWFGHGTFRLEVVEPAASFDTLGPVRFSGGPVTHGAAAIVVTDRPLGSGTPPRPAKRTLVIVLGSGVSPELDAWAEAVRPWATEVLVIDADTVAPPGDEGQTVPSGEDPI